MGTVLSIGVTVPLLAAGAAAVKSAANMEMLNAEFTTLLGDGSKATRMLDQLAVAAAKTPFALEDLANASKTMLAFGLAAEDVLPNLQMLGDIAGGNSEKLKSLTLAFSQIQSTGRLMGQDLLQLINAGFNPLQTISAKTGETMAELKKRMEQGGISALEVSDAFKTATSEGGLFFGGMERASQTFAGRLSTLKDDMAALGRQFGEILLPALSKIMDKVSELVKTFSGFSDGTKITIIALAAMAAATGPLIMGFGKLLIMIPQLITTVKLLAAPQALGALVAGGPILLGIAAAVAIIAAITVNTIKARQEQARYNEAIAGQLSMQETQNALEEKRARIAEERQRLAELERQQGRQGVAQAMAESNARITALQGEAAQLSNVVSGYQRQAAEEARLAPIRAEQARQAEEAARKEQERADALAAVRRAQEAFTSTLRNIDALAMAGAIKETEALQQKIKLRQDEIEAIKKAAMEGQITATAAAAQIAEQTAAIENYEARYNQLTANMEVTTTKYYDSANQQAKYWSYYTIEEIQDVADASEKAWAKSSEAVVGFAQTTTEVLGAVSDDAGQTMLNLIDLAANALMQSGDAKLAIVGAVVKVAKEAFVVIDSLIKSYQDSMYAVRDAMAQTGNDILSTKLKNEKAMLKATTDRLDAEMEAELRAAGLADLTAAEQANKKLAKAKESGDAEAVAEAEKELKKQIIIERYERQKEEAKKESMRRQFEYEIALFESNKTISLAQVDVDRASTISDLGWFANRNDIAQVNELFDGLKAAISSAPAPVPPAFARGTDFAPGGAAIVGERGPELVNLPAGAQVVPAHRTMNGRPGGGVTVNIYSPIALNPSEAASVMKQTGRELAFMGVM
jgi:tape measure domain-containing protein